MKCKCGDEIPKGRLKLGYKVCVNCSTESKWSVVQVNYHKTGNTTEVIKDPEVAADFAFMSSRKGFGVMRGLTSSRRKTITPKDPVPEKKTEEKDSGPTIISKVCDRYMPTYYFEEVGEKATKIAEELGYTESIKYIENSLEKKLIFKKQAEQLKQIIHFLTHECTRNTNLH
jgi:hypothetical protein